LSPQNCLNGKKTKTENTPCQLFLLFVFIQEH
jgi:hypothetical protein